MTSHLIYRGVKEDRSQIKIGYYERKVLMLTLLFVVSIDLQVYDYNKELFVFRLFSKN
jgi:hypothetical protein